MIVNFYTPGNWEHCSNRAIAVCHKPTDKANIKPYPIDIFRPSNLHDINIRIPNILLHLNNTMLNIKPKIIGLEWHFNKIKDHVHRCLTNWLTHKIYFAQIKLQSFSFQPLLYTILSPLSEEYHPFWWRNAWSSLHVPSTLVCWRKIYGKPDAEWTCWT